MILSSHIPVYIIKRYDDDDRYDDVVAVFASRGRAHAMADILDKISVPYRDWIHTVKRVFLRLP